MSQPDQAQPVPVADPVKKESDKKRRVPRIRTKDQDKMKQFAALPPEKKLYIDGVLPSLFPTGTAGAERPGELFISPYQFLENLLDISNRVTKSPIFSDKFYKLKIAESLTLHEYQRTFFSTSVLALAQKIIAAHVTTGMAQGDFSALTRLKLPVLSTVRKIADMYGDFRSPSTGQIMRFHAYDGVVYRLIRLARRLFDTDPAVQIDLDHIALLSREFYLPLYPTDTSFDGYFLQFAEDLINDNLLEDTPIDRIRLSPKKFPVFGGNADTKLHPSIESIVENDKDGSRLPALARLFGARPDAATLPTADVISFYNYLIPEMGGSDGTGIAVTDISLDKQFEKGPRVEGIWKSKVEEIANRWFLITTQLGQIWHVLDNESCRNTLGVWAQVQETKRSEDGATVVELPFECSSHDVTISTLYPSDVWTRSTELDYRRGMGVNCVHTTTTDLNAVRQDYIMSHLVK